MAASPISGNVFLAIISICAVSLASKTTPANTTSSELIYPNDNRTVVYIGAMFPLHSAPKKGNDSCGALKEEDGLLALESLLFSVDQINNLSTILPDIRIGVIVLDSCNSKDVALMQSKKFIKGLIASYNENHESEFICSSGEAATFIGGHGYDKVVGVVGGQHSSVSVQIANVLRLFNVPQISYRSTSSSLSEKDKFPFFLRTVPTDIIQAGVILKVLEHINVTYASLVYSNTEYGIGGFKEIMEKAKNSSVCFATPAHSLKKDDSEDRLKEVYFELVRRQKSNVVVLFADEYVATRLLDVVKTQNLRKFLWIGSDGWTSQSAVISDYSEIIEGAIGIQPIAVDLPGFHEYITQLTPATNLRNPWFEEYWESHFGCSVDVPSCRMRDLRTSTKFEDVKWLHFVRDSIYAFAHGLHDMWREICSPINATGLCNEMTHNGHIHGEDLFEFIKNVSFKDITNHTFRFQKQGSGTPRYTIFSYRRGRRSRNLWFWEPVANFSYVSNMPTMLVTNQHDFIWREDSPVFPNSHCGVPCTSRQGRLPDPVDVCCWQCKDCQHNQFLNNASHLCETCNACELPDSTSSKCVRKKEEYLDYKNQWAITSMAFATIGIFSTVFVGLIFWVHIDTPVIKAASRELSYILLTGILMSFLMTFAILAPPSPVSCGITRFFLGFSYTLCYSAILTKTNRISRIFNKHPSKPRKARYTSPTSQIIIVSLLLSVEVMINASWLLYYSPDVFEICDSGEEYPHNILICKGINDHSYIVGFIYPLFLVLMCTIYAIKTRKCPGGFNEARYITFTNYTTCIIWLVFVPLYLSTPAKEDVRIVSLAMSLSLGGFVQLGCLFLPKVHVVLFKPEKNTRDAVMSQQKGSSYAAGQHNSIARLQHLSNPNMMYVNGSGSAPLPNEGANGSPAEDGSPPAGPAPMGSPEQSIEPKSAAELLNATNFEGTKQ